MRMWYLPALAVSALVLGGCDTDGDTGVNVEQKPAPAFVARYVPTGTATGGNRNFMPYPNDIWGSATQPDGTINVPGTLSTYGAAGLNLPSINLIDGFSTNAPVSVPFTGPVDIATIVPYLPTPPDGVPALPGTNLWVVDITDLLTGGAPIPLIPLIPGQTDAIADYSYQLSAATDSQGAVLEIVPVKPFRPDRTIAFLITAGVADTTGNALQPDNQFRDIRDACFSGETLSNGILESIKTNAVCPILQAAAGLFGAPPDAFMVAWTMSTMSIGDSLAVIDETATAQTNVLVPTGLNTGQVIPGLPGLADIYTGTIEVPYYMDVADPYASTWQGADGSTLTRNNPVPVARTTLTIPFIATVPNVNSGQAEPAEGWPVVIYQHGVTTDRTTLIPIADTLASQGIVAVAIDLPLHGVRDATNPLFQGPGNAQNPFGNNERHFFLDNFQANGAPGPDGMIDNGAQIFTISLQAPLNTRDYGRQTASDLIHLVRTIPTINLDEDADPDLDSTRIHFIAISLGSLLGSSFLGNTTEIATATLSSPGGNWSGFLTDPDSFFGRGLIAGLSAATGLQPNTLAFDAFLRDWQHALDAVDPLNYAATVAANSPVHAIEILNDNTVPNSVTENFARVAGLDSITETTVNPEGIRGIVRFTDGGHGSLLDPNSVIVDLDTGEVIQGPNPLVTFEMQVEAAAFALSFGTQLPINSPLPQAGGATCDCVLAP